MGRPNNADTREERQFTPSGKRDRTPESLINIVPVDLDPDQHFFHLSRVHDLEFDRGPGGTRLYNKEDAVTAGEECNATCKSGRQSVHSREREGRLKNRPKKKREETDAEGST